MAFSSSLTPPPIMRDFGSPLYRLDSTGPATSTPHSMPSEIPTPCSALTLAFKDYLDKKNPSTLTPSARFMKEYLERGMNSPLDTEGSLNGETSFIADKVSGLLGNIVEKVREAVNGASVFCSQASEIVLDETDLDETTGELSSFEKFEKNVEELKKRALEHVESTKAALETLEVMGLNPEIKEAIDEVIVSVSSTIRTAVIDASARKSLVKIALAYQNINDLSQLTYSSGTSEIIQRAVEIHEMVKIVDEESQKASELTTEVVATKNRATQAVDRLREAKEKATKTLNEARDLWRAASAASDKACETSLALEALEKTALTIGNDVSAIVDASTNAMDTASAIFKIGTRFFDELTRRNLTYEIIRLTVKSNNEAIAQARKAETSLFLVIKSGEEKAKRITLIAKNAIKVVLSDAEACCKVIKEDGQEISKLTKTSEIHQVVESLKDVKSDVSLLLKFLEETEISKEIVSQLREALQEYEQIVEAKTAAIQTAADAKEVSSPPIVSQANVLAIAKPIVEAQEAAAHAAKAATAAAEDVLALFEGMQATASQVPSKLKPAAQAALDEADQALARVFEADEAATEAAKAAVVLTPFRAKRQADAAVRAARTARADLEIVRKISERPVFASDS